LANKSNICPIQGLAGIYISAFNKKTVFSSYFKDKAVIGSAHSIREICEKIRSKCNIIFLSPIFKEKKNKKAIGMIKFLLMSNHFKNITFYPLGGIYYPIKLRNYGVNGFAGIKYFDKT
jgi:thiamine monophosphate synthase